MISQNHIFSQIARCAALLTSLSLLTAGCSLEAAEAGEETVGETSEALTDVPGLTLRVLPIVSQWFANPEPFFSFGCTARFTDNVHLMQTRCILQEYTPQTNSWRNISDWIYDRRVGLPGVQGSVPCAPNRTSVLRAINRSTLRTNSGGWTDEEQLIGPSVSVRCVNSHT